MDRQFQNRLVGTIVLVAIGVIFLPDLLDGKKTHVVEEFTEIPLRPVIETTDTARESTELTESQPEQFEVEPVAPTQELVSQSEKLGNDSSEEDQTASSNSGKDDSQQVATTPSVESSVKSNAVTAGYTLQLGGFNNAQNVEALLAQLRLSGYTAYTLPEKPVEGKLTRVFVGPEVNKSKLEKAQTPIYKLTGLKGKIVAYNPTER
ncbi:SPOR domain-containing protein [Shewanella maritima]|uniref:SPOR domain-containing protein n=1 Tax=Shewanella maritima TaxID=2520507 RepID=UPI003734D2B4